MNRFMMGAAALTLGASGAMAADVRIGVSLGFTGPLESMAPPMLKGVELAAAEGTASGKFLNGDRLSVVQADNTCSDAAASVSAVERLVTSDKVSGIVGGMCSGETIASLEKVAVPNGMVMIAPSATSPALTTIEDRGFFFRTSPSDARQGEVMADIILSRGIKTVAVTYTNNDYGKGLAESFRTAFEKKSGKITIVAAHDDGKADYSADVGALAAAGGEALVVAGYVDQGGSGIVRGALDAGAFDTFVFVDGMITQALVDKFGTDLEKSFGQMPSSEGESHERYLAAAKAAGFDGTAVFSGESYDAAALLIMAMQAAKSTDPKLYKDKVMDIANAPGEKIMAGELAKALELIAAGKDIDYVGASAVEFVEPGESAGTYREVDFKGGKQNTVGFR